MDLLPRWFPAFTNQPALSLLQVAISSRRNIWAVAPGAIYRVVGGAPGTVSQQGGPFAVVPGLPAWTSPAYSSIAVGGDGTVLLAAQGSLWRYAPGASPTWVAFSAASPGGAAWSQVACASASQALALDASGSLYAWDGSAWSYVDLQPTSFGLGGDGTAACVISGTAYLQTGGAWSPMAALPSGSFQSIAIGSSQNIVAVGSDGNLWSFAGAQGWQQIPATDGIPFASPPVSAGLSVGADGTLWGFDANGQGYLFQPAGNPVVVSNFQIVGERVRSVGPATCTFTVTNTSPVASLSILRLTLLYDEAAFEAAHISVARNPIYVGTLGPGQSTTASFTIDAKGSISGPLGFHGVDASYSTTEPASLAGSGSWLGYVVAPPG